MAKKKDGKRGSYDVGYGKTPMHSRWPKGVSGNPSGKKRKDESVLDKLRKIAVEEIIVGKNGTPVAMTNIEAMYRTAFLKAQNGNPQFFRALLKELAGSEETNWSPDYEVSEEDLMVLETEADFRGLIEATRAELQSTDAQGGEDPGGHDDPEDTF